MRVMLSAGEASGDNYGALLLNELTSRAPVEAFGLGGDLMQASGCELITHSREVAAVGITEILRHIPRIYLSYRKLVRALRLRRPDLLVLIDFPDINFKLARHAHRLGIPVLFFISPQIWAWKKWRIRLVRRFVTKMLVIFPFEEQFYRGHNVQVEFVGHPLADLPLPDVGREVFAKQHGLDPRKHWITLMPGSRRGEVQLNLPTMLEAVRLLDSSKNPSEYLLPVASTISRELISDLCNKSGVKPVLLEQDDARAALFHSRASIVASGTATVEAALIGNPFVVVYRVSGLTYAVGKRLVTLEHYAMPNLIAGEEIVPELIQERFTAANVVSALEPLLTDSAQRNEMVRHLRALRGIMVRSDSTGSTAISRAADAVLALTTHG